LAEVYATLTRLPGRHRLSGEQVLLFLENIRERLVLVTLDHEEYFAALQQAATTGIVGGAVYDALLAHCALKGHAKTIYTWNVRRFQQMGPEIARRAKMP
jgi:predicted nucleic acid-binding protein